MDRSGPIWPPDELLGEDSEAAWEASAPSAGPLPTPEPEPIAPVWLDAGGATAPDTSIAAVAPASDPDDIRLTAEDWLDDAAFDTAPLSCMAPPEPRFSGFLVANGAIGSPAAALEGRVATEPIPTESSPWSAPPRTIRQRTEPAPLAAVPVAPIAPVVAPFAQSPAGPAPGVYDVPERRGTLTMRQITVVCRNENAGRAVTRLLTITLQHPDADGWDTAADLVRGESDFAHAGDMLARDQALTVVDAGPDVRAAAWERAVDATDQLVIAVNAAGSGPAEAVALIDALGRSRHAEIARRAVTVVLMPVSRWGLTRGHEDVAAIRGHFTPRSHAVFLAAFDLRPTAATRNVWREIAETVRAGLGES